MKVFFDVRSGEVVEPFVNPPLHYAEIDESLKVKEIYSCFGNLSLANSNEGSQEEMLKEDIYQWNNYPKLMKSLKKYILIEDVQSNKNNYDGELTNYIYLKFWERE